MTGRPDLGRERAATRKPGRERDIVPGVRTLTRKLQRSARSVRRRVTPSAMIETRYRPGVLRPHLGREAAAAHVDALALHASPSGCRPGAPAGTRTRGCDGASVPLTANAVPALARRLSVVSVMLGTTLTVTGADSSRARVPSPAKTARTWPLAGSATLVAQLPSGPQAVVVICVQAEPAVVYSTPSGAPAGEEPSAKRSDAGDAGRASRPSGWRP